MTLRLQIGLPNLNKAPFWLRAAIALIVFSILSRVPAHAKSMAIIGDSISTGGVSHPGLYFEASALWNVFRSDDALQPDVNLFADSIRERIQVDALPPPIRVAPTLWELENGVEWVMQNLMVGLSAKYLDLEEHSWGYQLGLLKGLAADQILVAAQDGARVEQAYPQLRRLVAANQGLLPNEIYIFFTGNDVCGPSLEFVSSAETFRKGMQDVLDGVLAFAQAGAVDGEVRVRVLGFMPLLQVADAEVILEKQVRAHGQVMTCKELIDQPLAGWEIGDTIQQGRAEAEILFNWLRFPKSPVSYCPTLYGRNFDSSGAEQLNLIANRMRSYRKVSADAVAAAQEKAQSMGLGQQVRLEYISATETMMFTADEVAQDCFHLSTLGQSKVANTVFQALQDSAIKDKI